MHFLPKRHQFWQQLHSSASLCCEAVGWEGAEKSVSVSSVFLWIEFDTLNKMNMQWHEEETCTTCTGIQKWMLVKQLLLMRVAEEKLDKQQTSRSNFCCSSFKRETESPMILSMSLHVCRNSRLFSEQTKSSCGLSIERFVWRLFLLPSQLQRTFIYPLRLLCRPLIPSFFSC